MEDQKKSITYESLWRSRDILREIYRNYKAVAPHCYSARGCATMLGVAQIMKGFIEELDKKLEETK